jgi:hypothetical protein
MSLIRRSHVGIFLIAAGVGACDGRKDDAVSPHAVEAMSVTPAHTMGSGSTSTLLGRATFGDPAAEKLKVKRTTGRWYVEIESEPALDIAVQTIVFPPGSYSGWHSHPGPVFIQIKSGTMTFYESDDPTCTPIVRTAGQGYLDRGDHAHIARNESASPAENIVTYFAPPGAALRIDEPKPGNCAF